MKAAHAIRGLTLIVLLSAEGLWAGEPISVCEIIDNADRYRGTVVTVRGEVHSRYEEIALYPTGCKFKSVWSMPYAIRQGDLSILAGRLLRSTPGWNSLWLSEVSDTPGNPGVLYTALKEFQANHPDNVPIGMTIVGTLEAARRGYGHMGAYVAQIVVQSVRLDGPQVRANH
jgi:hypothetical protein